MHVTLPYDIVDNLGIPLYYKRALREFLDKLHGILSDIECIGLVGSIARCEDFIEGWSDIDILVIVKRRDLIEHVKSIASEINEKYPKTKKGSGILSLWIDDLNNVTKWLGLGCEYYNLKKNFILLYGNDIRSRIKEPSEDELKRTIKLFVKEARKYLTKIKDEVLDHLDTLALASYVYPLLRFYLCIYGHPTASRREMIEIIREEDKLALSSNEREALVLILEDLLANKGRRNPSLNHKVKAIVEKILNEMDRVA